MSKLGGGGMGVVYEAENAKLGRRVAINAYRGEVDRAFEWLERAWPGLWDS